MKTILILLSFILIHPFSKLIADDNLLYLHCELTNDGLVDHFFWSIKSNNQINTWINGVRKTSTNQLVMNNNKNIAWNEIDDPMGIYVLDKKTMRQSGTLLSKESEILDRWVSTCEYLEEKDFFTEQINQSP